MRNKSSAISIGAIGVLIVAFSLAAFFILDIEKTAMNMWALTFLLLSEFILFGGLIGLRFTSKVFLTAGFGTILFIYFGATLLNICFAKWFIVNLNTFILVEIAIITLFAIITITIFSFSRGIERRNEEDIKKIGSNEPKRGGF